MSRKPAKKAAPSRAVGKDVDQNGNRLRPGTAVTYWSGDGRSELRPWPAFLSCRNNDGTWALFYMQRQMPSYTVTAQYSDEPRLHHWTMPEAHDDWDDQRQKQLAGS